MHHTRLSTTRPELESHLKVRYDLKRCECDIVKHSQLSTCYLSTELNRHSDIKSIVYSYRLFLIRVDSLRNFEDASSHGSGCIIMMAGAAGMRRCYGPLRPVTHQKSYISPGEWGTDVSVPHGSRMLHRSFI
jgi:hypothetical protein